MLTPIDIQNHVLKSGMGGYNKKETDDFIESVQSSYEQLYKENHDLKEKISTLSEGLQYYKQMEGTLQKALVLAEKTSTETLEAARTQAAVLEQESQEKADAILNESQAKAEELVNSAQAKADAIMNDAESRSTKVLSETKASADALMEETKSLTDSMLEEANRQLNEIAATIKKLISSYDEYKEQFKTIVSNQLNQLNSSDFQIFVPDLDQLLQSHRVLIAENQAKISEKIEEMVDNTDILEGGILGNDAGYEDEPSAETKETVTESLSIETEDIAPEESVIAEAAEQPEPAAAQATPSADASVSFENTAGSVTAYAQAVPMEEEPTFEAVLPPAEKPNAESSTAGDVEMVTASTTVEEPVYQAPSAQMPVEEPTFEAVLPPTQETKAEEPVVAEAASTMEAPVFQTASEPAAEVSSFQTTTESMAEASDFSFGVTGEDSEEQSSAEEATASALFTTGADFTGAGAGTGEGDGFGISSTPSNPSEDTASPFTFYDAN